MQTTMKQKSTRESPKAAQIGASWRGSANGFHRFFGDRALARRALDWKISHDHYLKSLQWALAEERP